MTKHKPIHSIEQPLRARPPRKRFWPEDQYDDEVVDLLKRGLAVSACVTSAEEEWVDGYEAGPRYTLHYRFETRGGDIVEEQKSFEFDGTHLAYDETGFREWIQKIMKVGQMFTVLYHAKDPKKHIIVGLEEIQQELTLVALTRRLRTAKSQTSSAFEQNLNDFLYLINPHTYDYVDDQGYLNKRLLFLLALQLGLLPKTAKYQRYKDIQFEKKDVLRFLKRKEIDREMLSDLSELCELYRSGVLLVR